MSGVGVPDSEKVTTLSVSSGRAGKGVTVSQKKKGGGVNKKKRNPQSKCTSKKHELTVRLARAPREGRGGGLRFVCVCLKRGFLRFLNVI